MGGLKGWTFPMSPANGDRLKTGASAVSPAPGMGRVPGLPAAGAAAAGPEPEPAPPGPPPPPARRGLGGGSGGSSAGRPGRGWGERCGVPAALPRQRRLRRRPRRSLRGAEESKRFWKRRGEELR